MTTIEAVTPESPVTLSGKYTIDSVHSRIGFVARHLMITKVRGSFDEFEGKATLDAQNPENSSVEIVIQAKSVNTRNQMRDDHLHSNDFLAVEEFPEIRFSSTKVTLLAGELEKGDEASLLVTGDLTVRGVTKPVEVTFEFNGSAVDPYANTRIGFEGHSKINRSEWGVALKGVGATGDVLVSEEITLEFEISAVKDGPAGE